MNWTKSDQSIRLRRQITKASLKTSSSSENRPQLDQKLDTNTPSRTKMFHPCESRRQLPLEVDRWKGSINITSSKKGSTWRQPKIESNPKSTTNQWKTTQKWQQLATTEMDPNRRSQRVDKKKPEKWNQLELSKRTTWFVYGRPITGFRLYQVGPKIPIGIRACKIPPEPSPTRTTD